MRISKDHPIFIISSVFIVGFTTAWICSEWLRVKKIEASYAEVKNDNEKLKSEIKELKDWPLNSPEIIDVNVTRENIDDEIQLRQVFTFKDINGDAQHINYVILRSSSNHTQITSGPIKSSSEAQINGDTLTGIWKCNSSNFTATIQAIITDKSGNSSKPFPYNIAC